MNTLFQNKTKNVVAISFAVLLTVVSVLDFDFSMFSYITKEGGWRYIFNSLLTFVVPLVAPVSLIVCSFAPNDRLKRWLLPIAFGVHWLYHLSLLMVSLSAIVPHFDSFTDSVYNVFLLLTTGKAFVANALIFVGFLLNGKPIWLLRIGSLLYVVPTLVSYIVGFASNGLAYYQTYWDTMSAIFIQSLLSFVSSVLFYVGLFILSTNKLKSLET